MKADRHSFEVFAKRSIFSPLMASCAVLMSVGVVWISFWGRNLNPTMAELFFAQPPASDDTIPLAIVVTDRIIGLILFFSVLMWIGTIFFGGFLASYGRLAERPKMQLPSMLLYWIAFSLMIVALLLIPFRLGDRMLTPAN